jgi:hypothetical protein
MSNKKKTIYYEFDDGQQELSATIVATCTKTGTKVTYYHKNLAKLIETKYRNNYSYFINNYICPEALREEREDDDPYRLNIYAQYLILCYKEALVKNNQYNIFLCAERFEKNFKRDIKQHLNDIFKDK